MGGKSTDFGRVADMQGEANRQVVLDQLFANRPNQISPWGYTSWTQEPYTDPSTGEETTRWTQTTGLTPELQEIFNKQMAIQGGRTDLAGLLTGRMMNEFGTEMDWSGLQPMGEVPLSQFTVPEGDIGNPYETRQRAEDAMYAQAQSRLNPQFDAMRQQAEIKMRNQGLGPQDAAWQAQMSNIANQENDARNQAIWSSVGEGRQESGQMFGQLLGRNQNNFNQALQANQQNYNQMMQGSQYANQIRQMQLAEAMQKRGFSLNEMNALLSGQQVGMPSMPSFMGAGAAQPAPYMDAYAQDVSMRNASNPWAGLMSGAFGLGSAALGNTALMSDRRLKRNIKRIGTVKGHPWYSFDYIWGEPGVGVMAQEVPDEYTIQVGDYLAVDYGKLLA